MTKAIREQGETSFIESFFNSTGSFSRELPDQFLRDTHIGFALLDADLNFIAVNDAYTRTHSQSADFFHDKNHSDLYPSDAQQIFEKVKNTKKPSRIKAHPVAPPKESARGITYWDWTVSPILSQENEVEALVLAEIEVTRGVRTEQAFYRNSKILAAIDNALEMNNPYAEPREILGGLLAEVIDLTESEYGFIGEVLRNADGRPCMKIHAVLNFTPGDEAQVFSMSPEAAYLEITDPRTMLAGVVSGGEAVIVNQSAGDPDNSGFPEGHPSLKAVMGVPFRAGESLEGVFCVANCADGYNEPLVESLQPLLKCYQQLILANAIYQEKHEALTSSEASDNLIRDLAGPAIEDEHSELIDLINECYEKMDGDLDVATTGQLLEKTYSAVSGHFVSEEQIMQDIGFPEYEAHKNSHDTFLTAFRSSIDHFVEGTDHDARILKKMLVSWFGRHWSTLDLDLNNYCSK